MKKGERVSKKIILSISMLLIFLFLIVYSFNIINLKNEKIDQNFDKGIFKLETESDEQVKHLRVLVLELNPILVEHGNIKASAFLNRAGDERNIVDELFSDIIYSSHGYVQPEIVEWIDTNKFGQFKEEIRLKNGTTSKNMDEETWVEIMKNGYYSWKNSEYARDIPSYNFDYSSIIEEYNLIERRNNNEFDWVVISMIEPSEAYETCMVGKRAYWINGTPINADCENFPIVFANIMRKDGALHSLGHMAENILDNVYGISQEQYYTANKLNINSQEEYDKLSTWEKFTLSRFNANTTFDGKEHYGPGSVHFPPNATYTYDYMNLTEVYMNWIDWEENYPNLQGKWELKNSSAWLTQHAPSGDDSDDRRFMRWWFKAMPHVSGRDEDGYYQNWWKYIISLDYVTYLSPDDGIEIGLGESEEKLRYIVRYKSGQVKTITSNENFKIEDTTIAEINSNGRIVGKKEGTTNATLALDGKKISIPITVEDDEESRTIVYSAKGYNGPYDENDHTITIECETSGVTIKYGETAGIYNLDEAHKPKYKTGSHTIYYKITKEGYDTVTGFKNINIQPASLTFRLQDADINNTIRKGDSFTFGEKVYFSDGGPEVSSIEGITATSSNKNIATVTPVENKPGYFKVYGVAPGTAKITIKQEQNEKYSEKTVSINVTVTGTLTVHAEGYTGTYDGEFHGINVRCQEEGATIKYGWFEGQYDMNSSGIISHGEATVYYQVEKEGYDTVTGSAKIKINPAPITIKLYDENDNEVTNATIIKGSQKYFMPKIFFNGQEIYQSSLDLTTSNANVATATTSREVKVDEGEFFQINAKNAGTATITVTHQGTDGGAYRTTSASLNVTVTQKSDISTATIEINPQGYEYDGSEKTPSITVKDGNTTLTNGTDYTVAYNNNKNAGNATITVTGKGNYTGTKTADFTIAKKTLIITAESKSKLAGEENPELTYTYSGNVEGQTPVFTGKLVTIATRTSPEGTYDILQGSLTLDNSSTFSAQNYTLSFVKGTLTVKTASRGGEVIQKEVSKIEIVQIPKVVTYVKNYGILDVTGGKIKVTYTDSTNATIDMTKDMVTGFDNSTIGDKTLTVTYNGKTATYNVTIVDKTISEIEMESLPTKTEYSKGTEKIDLTGAKIKVTYTDLTTEIIDITDEMISGFDSSKVGGNTVKVTYGDKEISFAITIAESKVTQIDVYQLPTKTEYKKGEEINLEGGKVIAYLDNDKVEIKDMTKYMINSMDSFDTVGMKIIKISYGGKEITFTVKVIEESIKENENRNNNENNNANNNEINSGNVSKMESRPVDNTTAKGLIPQTGSKPIIITVAILGFIISAGIAGIKIYKYKDKK